MKSDSMEPKTLEYLEVKVRSLLDHSRDAYEKFDAKDKVMETILPEMTQANKEISLLLARSNNSVMELSNAPDENSSILDFAVKIP